jgi:hypothetical protein
LKKKIDIPVNNSKLRFSKSNNVVKKTWEVVGRVSIHFSKSCSFQSFELKNVGVDEESN